MKNYIKLMRIPHYMKNGLIFLPIIFAGKLLDLSLLITCIFGFISFSMISSAVYIINDIQDYENDRAHDIKKNRPIASGAVSKKKALILACFLLFFSLLLNFYAAGNHIYSAVLLITYFLANVSYSFGLKNVPLVDIMILVFGFLIRVIYGGAITALDVSGWMYLTIISMSFYLGLGKRRNEIKKNGNSARKVLKHYTPDFLDKNMYMCLALTIVFYSMWCVDPNTIAAKMGSNLLWTVPVVMLICMKYSMNIEGDSYGDPVDIVINDKLLMCLIAFYCLGVFFSIYGQSVFRFLGI